jgi:hypothetical protein
LHPKALIRQSRKPPRRPPPTRELRQGARVD